MILNFDEEDQLQLIKRLNIPISFIRKNLSLFRGKNTIEWILENKIQNIEDDKAVQHFQ
jgi:hypothetical protein